MQSLKVKNITSDDISFDTFDLTAGSEKDLQWNTTTMTQETFGQMLAMHDLEMLEFVDALGNKVKESELTAYFIAGESPDLPQDIELDFDDNNLNYLTDNDLMSF